MADAPVACVHVCGGTYLDGRHRIACPTCDRETHVVTSFGGAWYGDILTCIECGDAWSDGERLERPFQRGWRERSKGKARTKWESALPRDEYLAAVQAEVIASVAYEDAEYAQGNDSSPESTP